MEELVTSYANLLHLRSVLREKGLTYETAGKAGGVLVRPRPEVLLFLAC